MKALIYGISGQDGAFLSQFLLEQGYEVWGASRDAAVASRFDRLHQLGIASRIKIVSATLGDFRSVLSSLVEAEPDEIYNLSGQSSVSLSFEQPVETMNSVCFGTLNLLEAIRFMRKKVKLYNASSSDCFGNTESPANEDTLFRPRSPYGVAKSASHWQVAIYREAYSLFACNGILFNHESPLRSSRFVTKKIISAVAHVARGGKDKLRLGNTDIIRDWGWAPDYVRAMWLMLQQPHPEDFVIATGESHSLTDFVECAFAEVGVDPRQFIEHDRTLLRPSEIRVSRADPAKAARQLEWTASKKMRDVVRLMLAAELGNQEAYGNGAGILSPQ